MNDCFLELTGTQDVPGAGRSVWVQVNEIPEGHWGTSGKTAGVMGIAMIAGLTRESEILDFTRNYLDAKERWMDTAAYPDDAARRGPDRQRHSQSSRTKAKGSAFRRLRSPAHISIPLAKPQWDR